MDMVKFSRRDFVKSSIAAAGFLATGRSVSGMQMMGGGGMGGGVIDPPIGAVFKDPEVMPISSTAPGVVEVNLEAKAARINVNGTWANLFTYNGFYPAPTIRVKKGDILKVNFTNSLPHTTATNLLGYQKNVTNLHTHGWHVSPNPPSDYVMYHLMHGETYNHVYDTSLQEAGTLSFYHPHKHGVSAEQYWAGLAGALVVEDENTLLAQYETHILVIKDITLSGGAPEPHSMC